MKHEHANPHELELEHHYDRDNLYIDMDGVVADYYKHSLVQDTRSEGYFLGLELIDGATDAIALLSQHYNVYFLSTAPWSNPFAWMEKRIWLEKHFGRLAFKKLILSHNKGLLKGAILIDDRTAKKVDDFEGTHIHFGTEQFPNWHEVLCYTLTSAVYPGAAKYNTQR